jgi:hypothetical protein
MASTSPPRGLLPRRASATSPPTPSSPPVPIIDRMPSTQHEQPVASIAAPEDVPQNGDLHARLLDAGALEHVPAPAPSLPSVPLPELDAPESEQQQADVAAQMNGAAGSDSLTLGPLHRRSQDALRLTR